MHAVRTQIARWAFNHAAPSVCSNLPVDIRRSESFCQIRTAIRMNYFHKLITWLLPITRIDLQTPTYRALTNTININSSTKHNIAVSTVRRISNVLPRVVIGSCTTDHSNFRLQTLHWLPIQYQIHYKLAVQCLQFTTKHPLGDLGGAIRPWPPIWNFNSRWHLTPVSRRRHALSVALKANL